MLRPRADLPLHPDVVDLLWRSMIRVSGDKICYVCGLEARRHDDMPFPVTCPTLIVLCSGQPVKV